ncbi:Conserved_hypothetical protein [Hexamita inflata]|uniref:Uncharacterized protein n=1 Tax=Hexamita inflata TaxID=28002 RepID=A0AA86P6F6_9EUKA|nr:Conserved hypothetical protein [Hexamita inflata]
MSTFSQIITSQQQDPDQYQYPSELEVTPTNNIFRKDDYVSLVSLTMKDLYSSQGRVLIFDTDLNQIWSVIQFNQSIDNITDLMMEFKQQQMQQVKQELIQITAVYDQTKFRRFQFKNFSSKNLKLQATGNLQNLFGIHNDIVLTKGAQTNTIDKIYNQLDDNSMRIQYVKICCEQINACMQNTVAYKDANKNVRNKQLFSTDVLSVVNRSTKFCYSNKNLDVHLQLLKNPPLTFRITDQDDRPVNISFIVLELMFYQKEALNFTDEVGSPSQIKGHSKQQMFISLETDQQEIQLPRAISQISLSDASGNLDDVTFCINNSHVQILRYDCSKYPLTYEEMQKLNSVTIKIPDDQMYAELYAIFQSKSPDEELLQDFYLFNEPEFQDYQNKFIDYDFLKCLQQFMQRIFSDKNGANKVGIKIEHDKINNQIQILTTYTRNDTVQNHGMTYYNQDFYYFGIQFINEPTQNIVNRIFFKDYSEGNLTNLFEKSPNNIIGTNKTLSVNYDVKVNLAEMFCYTSMFYIQVEQQDFDRILGVIVADSLILQPTNKSVFLWKNVYTESKKLTFKIVNYVETEDNKIVKVETKYIPNMLLRILVK